jgi:thiol-disulfide isomerase/thioredoxin
MADAMPQDEKPARRRTALFAAAAATAALAGAGLAWWRYAPKAMDPAAVPDLWELAFETPDGSRLAMQGLRGRPLLINFWATWCPPCIEELPLLNDFYRQNASKGWQVLGLAVDKPEPVRAFLARQPLAFPVALAGMEGLDLSRKLGNQAGGLPFTVLIGADGAILNRKIGKLSGRDLTLWLELK